MQHLILVKPDETHFPELLAYRNECLAHDDHTHGDCGLSKVTDIAGMQAWLDRIHELESTGIARYGWVSGSQYMLMHEGDPRILGMINFRHSLGDPAGYLARHGGHIGYGVRPSERGKGYATAMLRLCLDEARKRGL